MNWWEISRTSNIEINEVINFGWKQEKCWRESEENANGWSKEENMKQLLNFQLKENVYKKNERINEGECKKKKNQRNSN